MSVPKNKFAVSMGRLIQNARAETGMSQTKLAELTYLHRNSINNFENGKRIPDALTLSLIAAALEKPISYFFSNIHRELKEEDLSADEQTLLIQFRRIGKLDNRLMAVAQVKSIADLETKLDIAEQQREIEEGEETEAEASLQGQTETADE